MEYDNTSAVELRKQGIKRINYILLWGLFIVVKKVMDNRPIADHIKGSAL
ncbi:MAG: hypothetical protein KBE39_04175 [Parabacteroides sp.]|jgi:hypothetical protein|nr:hypothetical protein [Parabacteroides sp.]MBP9578723.1 hypothetical protein [Parabacteroides sp.]MDD2416837.1 hypothetical protein [Parabacteroides sp.]MDD4406052.1 hypothetical protein [Parabacteroides sp.]